MISIRAWNAWAFLDEFLWTPWFSVGKQITFFTLPQTAIVIVCGFEVSMHVLTFSLIRQYTIIIKLPDSNQKFTVFWTCKVKLISVHSTADCNSCCSCLASCVLISFDTHSSFFSVTKTAEKIQISPFCISEFQKKICQATWILNPTDVHLKDVWRFTVATDALSVKNPLIVHQPWKHT